MLLKSIARPTLALGLTSLAITAHAVTINVSPVSQPLYLGNTTTITVNLDNTAGPAMAALGEFAVTLPAEMHFTAWPAACTAGPAPVQSMTCHFAALAVGGTSSQVFSAQADVLYPTADHNTPGNPYLFVTADITDNGSGEPGSSYNTGPFYIDPQPIAPVPTLEAWGLGVLSLLIGAAALRRRRPSA